MTYIATGMSPDWSQVMVWERDQKTRQRVIKRYDAEHYFFVRDDYGSYKDIWGNKLDRVEFNNSKKMREAAAQVKATGNKVYESDISAEYKVLSKHYFGADIGTLNVTFFDIEVDYDKAMGFSSPENPYAPVNAVSIYHQHDGRMVVYAVPPKGRNWVLEDIPADVRALAEVVLCKTEKELLVLVLQEFQDSDILSGWNSEGFDIPYLYERLKRVMGVTAANKLSFELARAPRYKEFEDKFKNKRQKLEIFGRVHIDYLLLFTKFEPGERDSWALESVASEELDDMEKLSYEGSLADLYNHKFVDFIRYNIRDCEILKGLEDLKGYMTLAIMLSHMDAARIEDVLGTIKLTETAITNYCHFTLNMRVPDTNQESSGSKFGGAFVLPPMEGLHEMLASVDVTSLYPSAMRAINISPETIRGQFINRTDDFDKLKNGWTGLVCALMEDGTSIEMTVQEWKDYFIANKMAVSGFGTIFSQEQQGFIPALLTLWFEKRKEFKKKASEARDKYKKLKEAGDPTWREWEDKYKYYDKVQSIFKLKLNSTYGACGNEFFRYYDLRLAESTTRTGREILMHMARTVGKTLCGEYTYPNESVIYGDTDSCYFKTFSDNIEDALRIATIITTRINNSFPQFCRETFSCVEGFDDLIKVAQEVVADRGIFTNGKKSYMLHVLKDEGKDVDKIKITGLQIKKTTMPKPVRDYLTESFSQLLRGKEWHEIGVGILEFKEMLLASKLDKVGLPLRVKNLEMYAEKLDNGYTGMIPGHVRASIFWNKMLNEYDDKSSLRIVSGMKIKIYYLKNPIGKFKAIALPAELDVVPEWFTEHWVPRINLKKQILNLVDTKLKSMLAAIGERIPTRKSLLTDELFS